MEYALFKNSDSYDFLDSEQEAREEAYRADLEVPHWSVAHEDDRRPRPVFDIENRLERLDVTYRIQVAGWDDPMGEEKIFERVPAAEIKPRIIKKSIVLTYVDPETMMVYEILSIAHNQVKL